MTNSSLSKVLLFVALLAILLPVLLYFLLVQPAIEKKSAQLAELERKQQQVEVLSQTLEARKAGSATDRASLGIVRRQIPEEPKPDSILRDLRLLEVTSGLQMEMYNILIEERDGSSSRTNTLPEEVASLVVPVKIATQIKGSFDQVNRLLKELETMNRLYFLESATFSTAVLPSVATNVKDKPIEGSLTFVTFYAPGLAEMMNTPIPADFLKLESRNNPFY